MGVVVLNPPPPPSWEQVIKPAGIVVPEAIEDEDEGDEPAKVTAEIAPAVRAKPPTAAELMLRLKMGGEIALSAKLVKTAPPQPDPYEPISATATPRLKQLMVFRAVHPLYGIYLMDYLGKADQSERIQILESLLAMPGSVAKSVRVPWPDRLPPGPLSVEVVDPAILTSGLATLEDLYPPADQSEIEPELRKYPIPLAQKMRLLFENTIDHAGGLFVTPVWAVGDLLERGGDFDQFIRSRELVKHGGDLIQAPAADDFVVPGVCTTDAAGCDARRLGRSDAGNFAGADHRLPDGRSAVDR